MRRSFTLFSIVVHAIVISAALLAQVFAVGALPTPHQPVLYESASVMPIDVPLPKPRVVAPASTSDPVSLSAAPVIAPTGVIDETGHEGDPAPAPGRMIPGVEGGPSSGIDGIGNLAVVQLPPPPPPEPVRPIHLHSGMKTPVKIVDVPPIYPTLSRNAHIQGVVILEAVLDAKGRVESVRVLRSVQTLDQAAVDAVQQWRFTPALLNGQPVPVVMTVTVNFTLQ
jgi:periplasmic protein TonB